MVPHGRGHLLNVSNFQASPRLASYSATKANITSLTEALYEEMRGTGVRVTALCPGFTPTELSEVSGATSIASQVPSGLRLKMSLERDSVLPRTAKL
jgi:short-subunit dehydrogenase